MTDHQDLDPTGPPMTVPEVANRLRLSVTTIRRYLKEGDIPNGIRLKGKWLIPQQSLITYISTSTQGAS